MKRADIQAVSFLYVTAALLNFSVDLPLYFRYVSHVHIVYEVESPNVDRNASVMRLHIPSNETTYGSKILHIFVSWISTFMPPYPLPSAVYPCHSPWPHVSSNLILVIYFLRKCPWNFSRRRRRTHLAFVIGPSPQNSRSNIACKYMLYLHGHMTFGILLLYLLNRQIWPFYNFLFRCPFCIIKFTFACFYIFLFPPRMPVFDRRPVHVGILVEKVALGRVVLRLSGSVSRCQYHPTSTSYSRFSSVYHRRCIFLAAYNNFLDNLLHYSFIIMRSQIFPAVSSPKQRY
jgi:hypothetical protein